MSLEQFGWNDRLETLFTPHRDAGLEPARITREERGRCRVAHAHGEQPAEVSGRLRHTSSSGVEWPSVGDWVGVRRDGGEGPCRIEAVLPRAGVFLRKQAGDATEAQVVAANVEVVFVVAGLDADFNPRRIERYLAAVWDGGAMPAVVLNKADLSLDLAERIADV